MSGRRRKGPEVKRGKTSIEGGCHLARIEKVEIWFNQSFGHIMELGMSGGIKRRREFQRREGWGKALAREVMSQKKKHRESFGFIATN